MSDDSGKNPNREVAIEAAADKLGVPFAELRLWMLDNLAATPVRWSKWKSGEEGVPEKDLVLFLIDKLAATQAAQVVQPSASYRTTYPILATMSAQLDRIARRRPDILDEAIAHLARQVTLLARLADPDEAPTPPPPEEGGHALGRPGAPQSPHSQARSAKNAGPQQPQAGASDERRRASSSQ
jgi:hypothetical protein